MADKRYTEYDYEEIYNREVLGEESVEESIERLMRSKIPYGYVVKTIQSGDMLESEIYPRYERRKDIPKKDCESEEKEESKGTKQSQVELNLKNKRKYIVRLINRNFKKDDYFVTLTYEDYYLPNEERAKKDMKNFIERLRRYIRKHNLPELKYIYVIEFVNDEDREQTKKVRIHHHIIMNAVLPREVVEDKWGMGRSEARRLQPDEFGLEGIARYIIKGKKNTKSWVPSQNLKKPIVNTSVTKLTKRKAENMARNQNELKEIFEKLYKNKYIFNDCTTFISDITGGFYLYARMRKQC